MPFADGTGFEPMKLLRSEKYQFSAFDRSANHSVKLSKVLLIYDNCLGCKSIAVRGENENYN